ncbi:hypothetical protein PHMEG_00028706, partial [Phytophthora megakarya]
QKFVVAYSPWINGSVERANRDILQVLRAMIMEYKISHNDWIYLIPLVQANMNHSPVASLANRAPVEVFTGLPCPAPAYMLYLPDRQLKEITLLNKRKSRGAQVVNFSVGDYVLRSRVDERRHSKLLVTWVGPYVITRADSHSFRVRHLITGAEQDVHASRLKFYADSDLEVTEELLEHVAAQGIVLKVKQLIKHKWNEQSRGFELLVSWCGLETIENSWEPLQSLAKDVPALIHDYVAAANDAKLTAVFELLV